MALAGHDIITYCIVPYYDYSILLYDSVLCAG